MLLIYLWCAWMVGCGMMAVASSLWRRHKARNEQIESLEAEKRHLRSLLEFYENINECKCGEIVRIRCEGFNSNHK